MYQNYVIKPKSNHSFLLYQSYCGIDQHRSFLARIHPLRVETSLFIHSFTLYLFPLSLISCMQHLLLHIDAGMYNTSLCPLSSILG